MADGDNGSGGLEKLLADVQRTIRENDQFIRTLRDEASRVDGVASEEAPDDDDTVDEDGYEEL